VPPRHYSKVRPDSYGPLRLQPHTCKGEVAHEADETTAGRDAQPRPDLLSPECPTRGLPPGGKPALNQKHREQCASAWRRKGERVSESKLHGTVNNNLVALLVRGGESPRAVGSSFRVVHGDRQARRSFEQDPSLSRVVASELGHVARRFVVGQPRRRCQLARLYQEGQPVRDGQQRIVDQAKAQGNARDTGVVPGHHLMELNSTLPKK